jgi:DNA-binding XRE family transcriptional regulator
MASNLRYHRKQSGLTQRELADIVGTLKDHQVTRHESGKATPSLFAAIGYHVVFRIGFADLFPGLYEAIQQNVERNLLEFQRRLEKSVPMNPRAMEKTAQQLVWLRTRQGETN